MRLVSQAVLRRAFAGFLVVMGSSILYENRAVFTGADGVAAGETVTVGAEARRNR